jgi:hypothetical protein
MLSACQAPFLDARSCFSPPLASQHTSGLRIQNKSPSLVQRLVACLLNWVELLLAEVKWTSRGYNLALDSTL